MTRTDAEKAVMERHRVKFGLGDLVQLNNFWKNRIGIVKANDRAWWVATDCWDIANCICKASDVAKVLVRGAVPKKYLRYL